MSKVQYWQGVQVDLKKILTTFNYQPNNVNFVNLQNVENEKTRIYYIKTAQHVFKKLEGSLDNYNDFVNHFDDVISFLKTTKTNSGLHIHYFAISKLYHI